METIQSHETRTITITDEVTGEEKSINVLDIVFGYEPTMRYTFKNVPIEVANGFDTAESKGKYFHANIGNGKNAKYGEPEKAIIG